MLCRQTGSWQSTDAAAAGVSWDDSCVTSNGHQKRIVAIGGDGLRPTAETPADWVLTIDSMGEGYFICVGIIANTSPDVHGTTQNDETFHGVLSNTTMDPSRSWVIPHPAWACDSAPRAGCEL